MIKKIKVLVVEENRILGKGISKLINKQSDMKVVTTASQSKGIPDLIERYKPEIALIDIDLDYQNSFQLVKIILDQFPKTKIIVMDIVPIGSEILKFVEAGVLGFILKESNNIQFVKAIRKVAKGLKVLPPDLTGSLFSQIVESALNPSASTPVSKSVQLTRRELQVMELIAEGCPNKEIAQKLNISTYTVKSHVHNILETLSVHTRMQIAKYQYFINLPSATEESASLLDE